MKRVNHNLVMALAAWRNSGWLERIWTLGLAQWLVVLIATPISMWFAGDEVFTALATLGVMAQALVVLLGLASGWTAGRVAWTAAATAVFTWAAEAVGSHTGLPFGEYRYTELLQPQIGGVPLLIPLAWFMMLPPAWAVTEMILRPQRSRLGSAYWLVFPALAGVVFTAWDLYLDPQMVGRGLWVWLQPGGYFGIPWLNYFGWWLTASVLTALLRPSQLPRQLVWVYILTWIFQAIGLGVFWGQPGPAVVGFLGMGVFVAGAWLAWLKRSPEANQTTEIG